MKTRILILSLLLIASVIFCYTNRPEQPQPTVQYIKDTTWKAQVIRYRASNDSLIRLANNSAQKATQERKKRTQIEIEYKALSDRLNTITDDSAVGLFLDRADCSECPVVMFDSSYLVPIDPIRFYNDLSYSHDKLTLLNRSLAAECDYKAAQATQLQAANDTCRSESKLLETIINNKDMMLEDQAARKKKLERMCFGLSVLSVVLVVAGVL